VLVLISRDVKLILFPTALALLVGAIIWMYSPLIYEARTILKVEDSVVKNLDQSNLLIDAVSSFEKAEKVKEIAKNAAVSITKNKMGDGYLLTVSHTDSVIAKKALEALTIVLVERDKSLKGDSEKSKLLLEIITKKIRYLSWFLESLQKRASYGFESRAELDFQMGLYDDRYKALDELLDASIDIESKIKHENVLNDKEIMVDTFVLNKSFILMYVSAVLFVFLISLIYVLMRHEWKSIIENPSNLLKIKEIKENFTSN